MKCLLFALSILISISTSANTGGASSCPFNTGTCPLPGGRNHGFVQDYGYGGLTSMAAAAAVEATSPLATIVNTLANGPLNSECVSSLGAHLQTAGGVAWNGNCGDATRGETQTIQCAGLAGLGYSYDGNFDNVMAVYENLDPLQEELVYQTAVSDIQDFTSCQQSLFNTIATDQAARVDLVRNAYQQFRDVKAPIDQLNSQIERLETQLGVRRLSVQAQVAMSGTCASALDCIQQGEAAGAGDPEVRRLSESVGELQTRINLLVARIPLGNRDQMGKALREMVLSRTPVSPSQFRSRYLQEIEGLKEETDRSVASIAAIRVTQSDGDVNYCVDRELKKNLVRSGQLQTTIDRMGLKDSLAGFTCRAENRYGVAGEVITELALIPTYFVGYGAARLALKAGASTIRAVASAGRTLSTATRGAMLGLEAGDWVMATAAVIRDCNSDEFFARVQGQQGCDAMNEVGQMYEEASLAQCLSSALIPAASAMVGTGVRVINSRRLANAVPSTAAIDEVVEEGTGVVATAPKREFFLSQEEARSIAANLRNRGIVPGRRLTDAQLATLTPNERVSLFENMGDTAFTDSQGQRLLDIIEDAGGTIDTRAEGRLRELFRDVGKSKAEIDTIIQRARTNRVFETPAGNGPALLVRSADEAAPGSAPRSATDGVATPGGPARTTASGDGGPAPVGASASPARSADELLDELNDELRLAVPDSVPGRPDLATFANETRAAMRTRFESWPPDVRAQVSELLGQVQGQERRRYLAMLLNAHPSNDPSRALERIRLMRTGDANVQRQVMQELDAEIAALSAQMRGRGIFDLQGVNLGAQRSGLMTQRTLFDLGDEVEIQRIFSTDAYNDVARAAGREPHSISGGFNLDLKVTGSNVSVCRGSLATGSALSGLAGGFTTICRRGGYIDNATASDVLAAPRSAADGELGGYTRFNRFDLEPGAEVSMGRNGPVNYTFNGAEGTGGNGGGVEFFFSRSKNSLTPSDLSVSVRVPTCAAGAGTRCAQLLDIQAQIRIDNLRAGTRADGTDALSTASSRTDSIVRELADEADLINAGESAAQALQRLERNNPELLSALNLRREIELKTAPGVGRRDADTELMLSRIRDAEGFGPQSAAAARGAATDAASAQRQVTAAVRENPLTRAYNDLQSEAEQLLTRASRATDPADRDRLLREMARVRGQQADVRLAYHTYVYNLENALKAELRLGKRDPLPQGFLDAINSGAGGIVTRSN